MRSGVARSFHVTFFGCAVRLLGRQAYKIASKLAEFYEALIASLTFSSPEYCGLFALKKAHKGGGWSQALQPPPSLAPPLIRAVGILYNTTAMLSQTCCRSSIHHRVTVDIDRGFELILGYPAIGKLRSVLVRRWT